MPESQSNPEEKMEKLAAAIKRGWARSHPMTEAQKQGVINALRKQPSKSAGESRDHRPDGPEIDHGPGPG